MAGRDVTTLHIAFDSFREFTINNGIERVPEWWAFILETSCFLTYPVIFLIIVSAMVGYSKQLSSFYFLYQHLMGGKLENPYKACLLFILLWCGLYTVAATTTFAGVYAFKYGYLYGILIGIVGLCFLIGLVFIGLFVNSKSKEKAQMQTPPGYNPNMHMHMHQQHAAIPQQPVYGHIHAPQTPPPQIAPQNLALPHSSQVQGQGSDLVYEEAIALLGLKRGYSRKELDKRYKELAKKFHGDKGGSDALFMKIKSCYEYLLRFC